MTDTRSDPPAVTYTMACKRVQRAALGLVVVTSGGTGAGLRT